jgi:hypothetical protein
LVPGGGFVPAAARLTAGIAVGVVSILPLLHLTGVEETRQVAGIIARRLGALRSNR